MIVSSRGGGGAVGVRVPAQKSGTPKVQRSRTHSPRDAAMATRPATDVANHDE